MSESLKRHIREVPDYPREGILFYDITTLLKDPSALRETVDRFVWLFADQQIDKVIGIESRGFMFAPMVAYSLNAGFVPVRKPGKLPAPTVSQSYDLEYGSDSVEMHEDAVGEGERVLIVDDLLATGGTARATAELTALRGAELLGFGFIVELAFLNGRDKLRDYPIHSLITY
jgi:adenine phosphoribosyltransferase